MGGRGASGSTTMGLYQYHTTNISSLSSIINTGLKKSKKGQYGAGVYFANTEQDSLNWGEEQSSGSTLLRAKTDSLSSYGFDGVDDQNWTTKNVPAKKLQVKTSDGSWANLDNVTIRGNKVIHKYYPTKGNDDSFK